MVRHSTALAPVAAPITGQHAGNHQHGYHPGHPACDQGGHTAPGEPRRSPQRHALILPSTPVSSTHAQTAGAVNGGCGRFSG